MKIINRRWDDSLVYAGICILSLGTIWLLRVVITMAIRCAFANDDDPKKR